MLVRLIEEGFDPRYPWALCDERGEVMGRFKTAEEAQAWASRNHFTVMADTFPEYLD